MNIPCSRIPNFYRETGGEKRIQKRKYVYIFSKKHVYKMLRCGELCQ